MNTAICKLKEYFRMDKAAVSGTKKPRIALHTPAGIRGVILQSWKVLFILSKILLSRQPANG
ncbi:hypothetical protein [Metabacillus sp. 84]|uniref:hypothetical protein n=1 Tax=unclassified Metabacillus TaxID=2675274 RepID=UPI003CEFBBFF